MNYAALTSELTNDPLGRGYSGMSDAQAAASLNTKNRPGFKTIASADLLQWACLGAVDGSVKCRYERIQDAAASNAANTVRGLCYSLLGMIERETTLDLSKSASTTMIQALVTAGVLTAGEQTELLSTASSPISRGDELNLGETVGDGHVNSARNP